jgi:hypothetical protein
MNRINITSVTLLAFSFLVASACSTPSNGNSDGGDGMDADAQAYDKDCPADLTPCLDEDGVVRCVNLQSEQCHCGECGNQCLCSFGMCGDCGHDSLCGQPSICISGENRAFCANLETDPDNCGACNNPCSGGESCIDGVCQ